MLREARWVSYATLVKEVSSKSGMGTLGDAFGEKLKNDLGVVELRTAKHKPGIQNARSEDEVEFTTENRSAHELLGIRPGASARVVNRAFSERSKKFKPENILKAWRNGQAPLVIKLNAEAFYKALVEAKEQALAMAKAKDQAKESAGEAKKTEAKAEVAKSKPVKKTAKPEPEPQAEATEENAEITTPEEAEAAPEDVVTETAPESADKSGNKDEPLTGIARFERKYGDRTSATKTTKAKPAAKKTPEQSAGSKSLADQLAALKVGTSE
jgi:hypothetical protein